ncbi:MAG: YigZ family protein [Chitinophagaceae bacterium]|nr:YigZ family protein [Chitinophagaceae bacterium]
MIDKYTTILKESTADFRDRGSKFLAYAYPVQTLAQIKDRIIRLKKEHPKAVHHCLAWRLGTDGTQYRANDDGEPAGSAGKPILGQIDSMGLTNVLVVVVRYFGGTLLGVPGLINAYRTATADALAQCSKVEKWIEQLYEIEFDYPSMGEVLYILKQNEATIYKQELQLFCLIKTGIPVIHEEACTGKLTQIRGIKLKKIKPEELE